MFASVGADGSVRMFDLRHLEHSTIIYEDPQHRPLLRLAWNRQDPSYLATIAMDATEVFFAYFSSHFLLSAGESPRNINNLLKFNFDFKYSIHRVYIVYRVS